jgi:hypothetical protein
MLKLAVDEDLDNRIIWGLLLRVPDVDIKRVQDAGLSGIKDPAILEWAAKEGRILITHDRQTMIMHANKRVSAGMPMTGLVVIKQGAKIGWVIDDLVIILGATSSDEWNNLVEYVPL